MIISNGEPKAIKHPTFKFELQSDLIWEHPVNKNRYLVPKGFKTDGCSIPKPLKWSAVSTLKLNIPSSAVNLASFIHDLAFVNNHQVIVNGEFKTINKSQNDLLFKCALLDFGVSLRVADVLYTGVVVGSRFYW